MSANFYSHAIKKYGSRPIVKPTKVDYLPTSQRPSDDVPAAMVHPESTSVTAQSDCLVSINAQTTVPASLLDGGNLDFRPQRGIIDRFDHCYLRIAITNSTGASCTIQPSQLLLQSWQLKAQNGNKIILQQFGPELWLENAYYDYVDWEGGIKNLVGSNSSYSAAGVVIANNASTVLYIPLITLFAAARLHLGSIPEFVFSFQFNPASLNVITGSNPTVTNCSLLIRGCYLPEDIRREYDRIYKSPCDFPFLGVARSSADLTLAASSKYSIVLSGINHMVSSLFITFRASPITNSNLSTFINGASSYDIVNQDGVSITGNYQRSGPSTDLRNDSVLISSEYFDNLFLVSGNNANIIYISWNRSPKGTMITGSSKGYAPFTGFEKFEFTTPATLTPGAHRIEVWARTHDVLKLRNGELNTYNN